MSEFSICDSCLGSNDNIKMIKLANGTECKLCTRPFTVYRWHSNADSSTKMRKTIICQTCSSVKSCCQSCMLDIYYGISIDIRDTALKMAGLDKLVLQGSEVTKNREVKAIMADKYEEKLKSQGDEDKQQLARDLLLKLSSRLKEQKQKKPSKSVTTSGKLKLADKLPFSNLITKSDPSSTSFFVFGIDTNLPQYSITNFAKQFGGTLKSVSIIHRAKCGYIVFETREIADKFALHLAEVKLNSNNNPALVILDKKYPVRFTWGEPIDLEVSNDEQTIIGQVVTRAMKQLAEKDKDKKVVKEAKVVKPGAKSVKVKKI